MKNPSWNIADLFEQAVDSFGEREAIAIGESRRTYRELNTRANALAGHLLDIGVQPGDHIAVYAENCVEWVEALLAAFKIKAATVNVNYRYVESELAYIFKDAQPTALLFQRKYGDLVSRVGPPASLKQGGLVTIEDRSGADLLQDSQLYDRILQSDPPTEWPQRTGDERYIMYTGGTTGAPKGVLWRHENVLKAHGADADTFGSQQTVQDPTAIVELASKRPQVTLLTLGQLMHANGVWGILKALLWGDKAVSFPRFDPPAVWRAVEQHRGNVLSFVGDAMGRPLIEELEKNPKSYDVSSLLLVVSAAAVFSPAVQERFFSLLPNVTLVEGIGSSETGIEGAAPVARDGETHRGPTVAIAPGLGLVNDDNELIDLVPGATGRIARTGNIAMGYHNDPAKTAATFIDIDGARWSVPGDYAEVVDPTTIVLKGRGSVSINTGGEKVFAEEVERVLRSHPGVYDAVVVGVPDERWGKAVAAVLQTREGHSLNQDELDKYCRTQLAGYKVPNVIHQVSQIHRFPSGKPNYVWAQEVVTPSRDDTSTFAE